VVEQREAEEMAKAYKRGQTYWGRVSYRGKEYRKSLETASARVANERLLTFVSEVKSGKWGDKPRRKFEDAANKFIDVHFPRIKPNSAKRYRVSLMNLVDHISVVFLDEITSSVLSDFEVARRKQGVSDSTIRRDLMCLSSMFSCAREWEWTNDNPAAAYLRTAKKRGLVEAQPRSRFLSHDEEKDLAEHAALMRQAARGGRDVHGWQMQQAVFLFAIDTGLRAEEIFTLTWPQVDLKARQVTVRQEQAKSKRARTVPIFPRSLDLLTALPRSDHSQYVFWHRDGQRYRHMYRALMRACAAVGIADLEFHDLRRTCGVRLIRDHGFSIERVSLWLGHNNINITEKVYAFLSVDDLHKAVANSPMAFLNVAQTPAHSVD
jgi:integrase